jgi:hypothetical protein
VVKMTANVGEYLKNLTRGALKQPSELFFEASIQAYQIFSELISNKYETVFLRNGKQMIILRELTMLKLEKYVEEINDKCILCNKTLKSILIKNSYILANIFLNNYSKLINDQISIQNKDPSERKLLKFKS